MLHKTCLPFLFCFLFFTYAKAQDSTSHNKLVSVKQDAPISELLYKYKEYNRTREFADGYRIQIMYSDIRDEAYRSKSKTYVEFPDLPSYIDYEQPYFKLRLGDFRTRLEATYYLNQIVTIYSGAFIVKDKIRIKP